MASARSAPTRWALRLIVIAYMFLLVAWPVSLVAKHALGDGLGDIQKIVDDPATRHALLLTVRIAIISVAINTVFGVTVAVLIVRYRFPGRRLLNALLDLPLSVSPIVVGLSLLLVYSGTKGWFGPTLEDAGFRVIFATPGMVLATVFVSLPLVIREVVPVLQEIGVEQELAAYSLGASGWQTFWRVTLPNIKWGLIYGVVLCNARAMGEFGAVSVVSGKIRGLTNTMPLHIDVLYNDYQTTAAFATASLLALLALVTLVIKVIVERTSSHDGGRHP